MDDGVIWKWWLNCEILVFGNYKLLCVLDCTFFHISDKWCIYKSLCLGEAVTETLRDFGFGGLMSGIFHICVTTWSSGGKQHFNHLGWW